MLDGEPVTTCPYIWVDRDFALVRGWIQGFPKKLGSVWMTRSFGLDCLADPGLSRARFGGTLAANDRRLARGHASRSSGSSETGPTHNDPPLVNVRHFPRLAAGRHDEPGGARARRRASAATASISPIWEGSATLELLRRAERGARRARARADGQGLPLHVRLHGRRPRDERDLRDRTRWRWRSTSTRAVRASPASTSRPTTTSAASASRRRAVRGPLADRLGAARRGRARRRAPRSTSPSAPRSDAFPAWAALGAAGRAPLPAPARRPDRRARRAPRAASSASTWRCSSTRCGRA